MGLVTLGVRTSFFVVFLLAGCVPEHPKLGGLTLETGATVFSIKAGDRVLLESSSVVAPVATRVGRARYEMQYGSFKIADNPPEWIEGQKFAWGRVESTDGATLPLRLHVKLDAVIGVMVPYASGMRIDELTIGEGSIRLARHPS